MKNTLTAKRLREALELRNMKCAELAEKTGISKASISQYYNGVYVPTNIKSGKIAEVLNVSPAWLMGFDVQMIENENINETTGMLLFDVVNDIGMKDALEKLIKLSNEDKQIIYSMINSLYEKGNK